MLSLKERKDYLLQVIVPQFESSVDRNMYLTILDCELLLQICTNLSAASIGYDSYRDLIGLSYNDYGNRDICQRVFGDLDAVNQLKIAEHIRKIIKIQQSVIDDGIVRCFIDLLPYQGNLKSWLVTCVPLFHPSGEVVGMQSIAVETRFLCFQDYITESIEVENNIEIYLTNREREVIFLVANGITQERIGRMLGIARSTVATVISSLCNKFGIEGYSGRLLASLAIKYGYYKQIPDSLLQPCVILMDEQEKD